MTWNQARADHLTEGDRVLWGQTRTVQSVAGNADRVVVTFDDRAHVTFGRESLVWKADRTSEEAR